jgi:uroporphyrinogen-III synthase
MADGRICPPLLQAGEGANESLRELSDKLPLAGLKVVVTRPLAQVAELAQRIAEQGGEPIIFPLLEIGPASDTRSLQQLARDPAAYHLFIFISPNAVAYGMAALGTLPETSRIAAVGQASAQALRDLGIAHVIAPTDRYDSEALLALPELQDVSGRRVAILRGDNGRELLGDTLKARGALVDYVTCYERRKPQLDGAALLATAPDAIMVTSSEALTHLWQMYAEPERDRLAAIPLFVQHVRIAELARQQGWRHVTVTPSGDDGMLAALIAWAHTERN